MKNMNMSFVLSVLMLVIFTVGCGKRSSEPSRELDQRTIALDQEIDIDKENAIQGYRDAYRKTSEEYIKFQLLMDKRAIIAQYPTNEPMKQLYLERADRGAQAKRQAVKDNITTYEAMIDRARKKQDFKQGLLKFQQSLHDKGFSAQEAASLTQSIGDLILSITGNKGTVVPVPEPEPGT